MKRIKLITLITILSLVGIVSFNSYQSPTKASGDSIFEEIANYKTWTKVSKDPIKVDVTIGADLAGG